MSPTLPAGVLSVLGEARQAYIGIETKAGPHVTPELYAWSDDRLWFATATSTLKAKVLRDGGRVAIAVVGRGSTVVLEGRVEVFDPRHPLRMSPSSGPALVRATAAFGVRNGTDLVGFAKDVLAGATERRVPNLRLFVAVTPEKVALVENDHVVWRTGFAASPDASPCDVPAGGAPAVVAFPGPRVAPARWFADDAKAFVAPNVLALHDVRDEVAIAVVVDHYNGPGPAAKDGVLVRGDGAVQGDGWLAVTAQRTVEWDGTDLSRRAG